MEQQHRHLLVVRRRRYEVLQRVDAVSRLLVKRLNLRVLLHELKLVDHDEVASAHLGVLDEGARRALRHGRLVDDELSGQAAYLVARPVEGLNVARHLDALQELIDGNHDLIAVDVQKLRAPPDVVGV